MKSCFGLVCMGVAVFFGMLFLTSRYSPEIPEEPTATQAPASKPKKKPIQQAAKHIPGMNQVDLYLNLEQRGFTKTVLYADGKAIWTCKKTLPDGTQLTADCFGKSSAIESFTAWALSPEKRIDANPEAIAFVRYIGTLPYDTQDNQAFTAWLDSYFSQRAIHPEKTIGDVTFTLSGNDFTIGVRGSLAR
jgi:hypothetical protein